MTRRLLGLRGVGPAGVDTELAVARAELHKILTDALSGETGPAPELR